MFLFYLLTFSYAIKAQRSECNLNVRGHIMLADSARLSAKAASVFVPKLNKGILADSSGNFVITNICPGKLELVITYAGYKTIDTILMVAQNSMLLSFHLADNTSQLDSVTVTGEIIHKDQITTAVKVTFSGAELEQTRGLSLGESLKSITGVNSLQSGPSISKPIIHGVYSNRILILNNGIRQEGQNWGNDHAPEIDPFIATRITIIKGAASIRYGSDAIGGVILLDPKEMRTNPGVDGELNLVGMTNGLVRVGSGMIQGAA
ncbi:MAG TPA: TonB-dependent receptor plug domain-containing protein, partial [Puia sp.]|nr:TonB-dependent receptor plug domain-containing protein [Puia sp.]